MNSAGNLQHQARSDLDAAALHKLLFDDAPYGLLAADVEGNILSINTTAQTYLSCSAADVRGTSVDAWLSNGSTLLQALLKPGEERATAPQEGAGRRPDGSEIPLEIVLNLSGAGADAVIIFTLTDLSLRYSAERLMNKTLEQSALANEALERANKSLDRKNRELNALSYAVAHDLKAPMVNIQGFSAELAEHCVELDAKLSQTQLDDDPQLSYIVRSGIPQALAFITNAAHRMDSHLNGILHMTHLNTYNMVPQQVDLAEVVRAAEAKYRCDAGNIELALEIPSLWMDKEAITVIVDELVSNAYKFAASGRTPEITFAAVVQDEDLRLSLTDNGVGIAADNIGQLAHLFRRFAGHDSDGLGMGLSYVYTLLNRLNGRMQCSSELQVGSQFTITIPRHNCFSEDAL